MKKRQTQEEINQIKIETDRAIKRGLDHVHVEWRNMALKVMLKVCQKKREFTMNDVRDIVKQSHIKTHDNRAMGGIAMTALNLGWISHTGKFIISRVGHKSILQVWKSNVYKGK